MGDNRQELNMAAMEERYKPKEAHDIVAADKIAGTVVYNMAGDKVGTIRSLMIDKLSGKVVFANMGFGGVLGVGEKYSVLPWNVLTYDIDLGGYQLDIDREKLEAGPAATEEELTQLMQDRNWGRRVYDYYGSSWSEGRTHGRHGDDRRRTHGRDGDDRR